MSVFQKLLINYPYTIAVFLFVIAILIVLNKSSLFKKLIGINIMQSAIFILFVGGGNIKGGAVPILGHADSQIVYISPLPSALMLTGIVVSVSVSAFALALIIRLYKIYGTTDARRIAEIRNEAEKNDVCD
jgi:multicomponent Na+:H+ antiporter subunit C